MEEAAVKIEKEREKTKHRCENYELQVGTEKIHMSRENSQSRENSSTSKGHHDLREHTSNLQSINVTDNFINVQGASRSQRTQFQELHLSCSLCPLWRCENPCCLVLQPYLFRHQFEVSKATLGSREPHP
ncbi:hypothetical protein CsSME_00019219 [Camellia sinensis var. sinensis]